MKRSLIVHPLLFSIYPILFLYAHNIDLDPGTEFVRPALVVAALVGMGWIILRKLVTNREKAALLLTITLLLFFSYGHVNDALGQFSFIVGSVSIGKSKTLFLVWILLFAIGSYLIVRKLQNTHRLTALLNVIGGVLVLFPILTLVGHATGAGRAAAPEIRATMPVSNSLIPVNPASLPNIYYIVLDGYGRADIVQDLFGHDNNPFLGRLRERGFYVAERSNSNYAQTILSLASSLNSVYLHEIAAQMGEDAYDRKPLLEMIRHNNTVDFLRQFGYKFVTFSGGYWGVEIKDADIRMRGPWSLSEFEMLLLNTTPIPDVLYGLRVYDPWEEHRNRLLYILDNLADTTEFEEPIFVLAHIICPHPPFVFGEHGEKINQREINPKRYFTFADGINPGWGLDLNEYRDSYVAQLKFISQRIESTVDELISRSRTPPIIILQGDHGPSALMNKTLSNPDSANLKERMRIFNAYYLPEGGNEQLYSAISPVNSFRVVLNHYFGTDYERLPDESYFSTWFEPYDFSNVTGTVNADLE